MLYTMYIRLDTNAVEVTDAQYATHNVLTEDCESAGEEWNEMVRDMQPKPASEMLIGSGFVQSRIASRP